ncbi:ATP-binding protein, partial [Myxococcota bacterium]|nr:ATP-binding protein [Myxococcota bacterium]
FVRAAELLPERFAAEALPPADRRVIAEVLVEAGRAEEALAVASGSSPDELVARAAALAALGRTDEARRVYQRAVAENPTLEDPTLAERLAARPVATNDVDGGRPRFHVIDGGSDAPGLATVLAPEAPPITFADVGGLEEIKEQIRRRIILPFQKPSLFERFKRKAGGGILLYGPPGVGKTMLARATAGECHAKFFSVAISDVLDMYIGESEAKLHAIFEKARASRPAVLFFDELEALGGKRQFSRESHTAKLVSQFLSEMDGFASNNGGVLVLGATNTPWAVDPAFRRPGRFDRSFFVPPPDREARVAILELKLDGRPTEGDLGVDELAKLTSGFSGADLENIVDTAADLAIEASLSKGTELPITGELLRSALREVKPSTMEWLTTARNHARYANESGQYDEVLEFLRRHGKS